MDSNGSQPEGVWRDAAGRRAAHHGVHLVRGLLHAPLPPAAHGRGLAAHAGQDYRET